MGVIEHPFLPKIGREKIMGNSAGSWKPPCSSLYPFLDQAADHPISVQPADTSVNSFEAAGSLCTGREISSLLGRTLVAAFRCIKLGAQVGGLLVSPNR